MTDRPLRALLLVGTLWATAACATQQSTPMSDSASSGTSATGAASAASAAADGWRSLLDGTSTAAWRAYRGTTIPTGWRAANGELTHTKDGGDIVTVDQFGDFELELEWKVAEGGNSGIFYRGTEAAERIYETAPEYQVLDDARHVDGRNPLTSAAAAYGLYAAPRGVVKPAGEWNATRIVARGPSVEHWLNGQKVVAYELGSADWEAKVKASKFAEWPGYGRAMRGHIGLQDHGDVVSYRNIRIRELK
jgi:hypothetical protein